jgi:RNA polymerase sigma-70 factor (ECF subfamily)
MGKVQADDQIALASLVKLYWAELVKYAARVLEDPDAANDVALGTFERVWEQRGQWRPSGSLRSYLFRIARNLVIDEHRKRRVRTKWARLLTIRDQRCPPTPHDILEQQETQAEIEHAIQGLPERRRETFTLAYRGGLTYREIAGVMGTSPQTAANQLTKASEHLRRVLAGVG